MNKQQKKKEIIFNIFSKNLEWVKKHPDIKFKPDFNNGYICPLCFEVFFKKDLDSSLDNFLTLEDIPPVSLGGKPLTLTCKKCNSKSGHNLDVHLLNQLLEADAKMFLPNSEMKSSFEIDGNTVNGKIKIDDNGKFIIDLQTQNSNPIQSEEFKKGLFYSEIKYNPIFYPNGRHLTQYKSKEITMRFKVNSDERRAEIALLRIAYLIAFATLGNSFLINGNLYKVREQILNPDKKVLSKVFWIKYKFPEECKGINIISLPKEMRCFLVIFDLKTKSKTRQFAIVLPGPDEPGINIYEFLEKELCVDREEKLEMMLEHIPEREFIKDKNWVFGSHYYWQEYTNENYKPRLPPK